MQLIRLFHHKIYHYIERIYHSHLSSETNEKELKGQPVGDLSCTWMPSSGQYDGRAGWQLNIGMRWVYIFNCNSLIFVKFVIAIDECEYMWMVGIFILAIHYISFILGEKASPCLSQDLLLFTDFKSSRFVGYFFGQGVICSKTGLRPRDIFP